MKKLFVAFCVLTVSLFGVLGCSPKADSDADADAGAETSEAVEEADEAAAE